MAVRLGRCRREQARGPAVRLSRNQRGQQVRAASSVCTLAASLLLAATVACSALAFVCDVIAAPVNLYDESILLVSSMLVDQGLIPHRDFWSIYPSLAYYLNSWVFDLLGASVVSARLLQALLYVLFLGALFLHFRRVGDLGLSTSLAFTLAATLFIGKAFIQPWWPAYALCALGLLLYLHAESADPLKRGAVLAISGLFTGLACLARLNFGSYIAGAVLVATLVPDCEERHTEPRAMAKRLLECCLCAFPIAVCAAAYLLTREGLDRAALEQLLSHATSGLGTRRMLPIDISHTPFTAFLLAVCAAALPLVWLSLRSAGASGRTQGGTGMRLALFAAVGVTLVLTAGGNYPGVLRAMAIYTALSLVLARLFGAPVSRQEFAVLMSYSFFLHYFFSRADESHFAPLLPLIPVLAAYTWPRIPTEHSEGGGRVGWRPWNRAVALSLAVSVLGVSVLARREPFLPAVSSVPAAMELLTGESSPLLQGDSVYIATANLPLAQPMSLLYSDKDEVLAVRHVTARTNPSDHVYVGLTDHSRILANDVRVYWLLGRLPGVRKFVADPGVTTEPAIQQEMIGDLERNRVAWLVLTDYTKLGLETTINEQPGSRLLDEYIRTHYQTVAQYGLYSVLQRTSPFR